MLIQQPNVMGVLIPFIPFKWDSEAVPDRSALLGQKHLKFVTTILLLSLSEAQKLQIKRMLSCVEVTQNWVCSFSFLLETGEMTNVHVFGKWHHIPRKQVTYGDPELTYTYSGVTFSPKPWIPVLNRIRERVTSDTGHTFNFVVINRYKDGEDHIGEHRDDERELVPRSPIASVSFGACRDFVFRHCASRGKNATCRIKPIKLQLAHGSLLMMKYPTNVYWYHSLPPRKRVLAPRVNLTFRKLMAIAKK
ncbi:DNA oxidative demethylase ALKBH2 isoform 1-T1 [Amazona ochrocephala]